jgi:hypothetical protein
MLVIDGVDSNAVLILPLQQRHDHHSSVEDELAALGTKIDNERLVRNERDCFFTRMIEPFDSRRVAHADRDVIFACRHDEALIDPRRPIACYTRRRQALAENGSRTEVKFDIKRTPAAWTGLHTPHIGRKFFDFLRCQEAAFSFAVCTVNEGKNHDSRSAGKLLVGWPIGKRGDSGE